MIHNLNNVYYLFALVQYYNKFVNIDIIKLKDLESQFYQSNVRCKAFPIKAKPNQTRIDIKNPKQLNKNKTSFTK